MGEDNMVLQGSKAIMDFIGVKTYPTFRRRIKAGLPAYLINGRWFMHKRDYDEYHRKERHQ